MIAGISGYIYRNTPWLGIDSDWSKSFYVRLENTPPVGSITIWGYGDIGYGDPYIWLGGGTGTNNIHLEVYDGSTTQDTADLNLVDNTNYYLTIRYTAASHLLEFIKDGTTIIGSISVNLSATAFTSDLEWMVGDTPSAAVDIVRVGYERFYQKTQTLAEIVIEKASITPISIVGLLSSCPLQTSIDLTDHFQSYLAVFTASAGTVSTNTSDPLLSVVAGPPANITPGTATEINADSALLVDTLSSGSAAAVTWYKYTAILGDKVIGLCIFGGFLSGGTNFIPTVNVFEGLTAANAGTPVYLGLGGVSVPIQFPVISGNTYYFRLLRNAAVTPATAQISLLKCLNLPVPTGSIAVNDDTDGFPLALLDVNTGYPLNFINNFPAGEGGSVTNSGKILVDDISDIVNGFKLYASNYLTLLASIPSINKDSLEGRTSTNGIDTFLIAYETLTGDGIIRLLNFDGALNPTIFTLGSSGADTFWAYGLKNDATIAYYMFIGIGSAIKTWNLSTNMAGADLVAGIANYSPGKDILVLSNGSVIAVYFRNGTGDTNIKVYSAAGATLHTYAFGMQTSNGNDNRLASAIDDPNSFWAWIRTSDGFSRFINIKISDGSFLTDLQNIAQFEAGTFTGSRSHTPARFGHSESCPFWITRVALFPMTIDASGLYILTGTGNVSTGDNPALTHDKLWLDASIGTTENVAIPNPSAEGYLIGDE